MDTDIAAISEAFAEHREVLAMDGIELRIRGVADDVVDVDLYLSAESCADCMLPRPLMEELLLDAARAARPEVSRVVVHEPRLLDDVSN